MASCRAAEETPIDTESYDHMIRMSAFAVALGLGQASAGITSQSASANWSQIAAADTAYAKARVAQTFWRLSERFPIEITDLTRRVSPPR